MPKIEGAFPLNRQPLVRNDGDIPACLQSYGSLAGKWHDIKDIADKAHCSRKSNIGGSLNIGVLVCRSLCPAPSIDRLDDAQSSPEGVAGHGRLLLVLFSSQRKEMNDRS
jgi:hypothetical protein